MNVGTRAQWLGTAGMLLLVFAEATVTRGQAAAAVTSDGARGRTAIGATFDVRQFGAKGDGTTLDTAAIQRAIDDCARSGGVVVLSNGTFLSGSLTLKSHVELHLTSTAVLLGSDDLAQYRSDEKFVYKLARRALVFAEGCEHVAITGQGTIDGQGKLFPKPENRVRPHLIHLRACSNVRIEGLALKNSAMFAAWLIQCQQMRIEGLRINNRVQHNNDGLDIDGCRDVSITNCNIRSGDDSIALKTSEAGHPCRDIVITNCILSSDCAAIRVGPDAVADIENVSASNCVVRDTRLNGIKIEESFGATMQNMVFSNFVMDNVSGPISIRLAGWKMGTGNVWGVFDDSNWEKGRLRNVLFDNIRARSGDKHCISITGTPRTAPENIRFSNIDVTFIGGGTRKDAERHDIPEMERHYPEMHMFGTLPAYGLYVRHAKGITLDNVRFALELPDLRPAMVCDDVEDLDLAGFRAAGHAEAEALIRLQGTRNVFITGSRPTNAIGTFLHVEGPGSQGISLRANKLSAARKAVNVAEGLPPDVVSNEK
jgi:hypothetical protein